VTRTFHRSRTRRFALFMVSGISLLLCASVSVVYRTVLQRQLDSRLISAVYANDERSVAALLAHGANANPHDSDKSKFSKCVDTVMNWLHIRAPRPVTTNLLMDALEIDSDRGHSDGSGSNDQIVEALILHGADVNRCDPDGYPPLLEAASDYRVRVVSCLLKHGADPNMFNPDRGTVLYSLKHQGLTATVTPAQDRSYREIIQIMEHSGAKE